MTEDKRDINIVTAISNGVIYEALCEQNHLIFLFWGSWVKNNMWMYSTASSQRDQVKHLNWDQRRRTLIALLLKFSWKGRVSITAIINLLKMYQNFDLHVQFDLTKFLLQMKIAWFFKGKIKRKLARSLLYWIWNKPLPILLQQLAGCTTVNTFID